MKHSVEEALRQCLSGWKSVYVDTVDLEGQVIRLCGGHGDYALLGDYPAFAKAIGQLVEQGQLSPVQSARSNGRNPALKARFRRKSVHSDDVGPKERAFLQRLHPTIRIEGYQRAADVHADWNWLERVDAFLRRPDRGELLQVPISVNERSLQVFGVEKLLREQRDGFLRRIGMSLSDFSVFIPSEPYFAERLHWGPIRRALVVENLDTYQSIRRAFLCTGRPFLHGPVDLLIWGEGYKIVSSLSQLREDRCLTSESEIAYFGDIDADGMMIMHLLSQRYPDLAISPCMALYQDLLHLGVARHAAAPWAESTGTALQQIPDALRNAIIVVAQQGLWYPQEGLTHRYFLQEGVS